MKNILLTMAFCAITITKLIAYPIEPRLKALRENNCWLADGYMLRLKHRADPAKVAPILKSYNEIALGSNKNAGCKKYIEEFIKLVDY